MSSIISSISGVAGAFYTTKVRLKFVHGKGCEGHHLLLSIPLRCDWNGGLLLIFVQPGSPFYTTKVRLKFGLPYSNAEKGKAFYTTKVRLKSQRVDAKTVVWLPPFYTTKVRLKSLSWPWWWGLVELSFYTTKVRLKCSSDREIRGTCCLLSIPLRCDWNPAWAKGLLTKIDFLYH